MTVNHALDMIRETLTLMLFLSLPVLAAALVVGLAVSLLQAVTQIQEQTLSFVPKILGMGIAAVLVMPWMTMRLLEFAERMFAGY